MEISVSFSITNSVSIATSLSKPKSDLINMSSASELGSGSFSATGRVSSACGLCRANRIYEAFAVRQVVVYSALKFVTARLRISFQDPSESEISQ